LLGNADSLALKFNNLKVFYKQALPMVGWDAYKTINIKYTNQVIGLKTKLLDSLNAIKAQSRFTKARFCCIKKISRTKTNEMPLPVLED
jgi:cell division protein FtsQ